MEIQILDQIAKLHTPILDKIMWFITTTGNAGILWIALGLILVAIPKYRRSGLIVLGALLVDVILCNGILKNVVARTRPYDINTAVELLIKKPTDYSFPSGHTAASFAAVTALFLAGEKRIWKISLIWAVLIAFSRLYMYVHFPTDVLGGMLLGILAGYIGYRIVNYLWGKKTNDKQKTGENQET